MSSTSKYVQAEETCRPAPAYRTRISSSLPDAKASNRGRLPAATASTCACGSTPNVHSIRSDVPVRLCRRRPDLESWVADQSEPFPCHRRLQHVRAGARDTRRPLLFVRHRGRNRVRERQRELEEELGVGGLQVECDRLA